MQPILQCCGAANYRSGVTFSQRFPLRADEADDGGCTENFRPSLIGRYMFGRGNVRITGPASGLLNMIGEGLRRAPHSGAIAGEALVAARCQPAPPRTA